MCADIHYGQEQVAPLKGPNTDERDQSSPDQSHPACNARPVHTDVPLATIAMRTLSHTTEPLLAIARIGQRVTAIVSFYRPSNGVPAHGRARLRATHTRCDRLGWRHVRDLCLPAPGARHA